MPDGSVIVIVSSINPAPTDVQVVPQNVPPGKYRLKATVDTCKAHTDCEPLDMDTEATPGLDVKAVPPFSITVLRFEQRD